MLEQSDLSKDTKYDILLDLAKDYIQSGMLNLSEPILQDIIERSSKSRRKALELLRTIYDQESSWVKALHVINLLMQEKGYVDKTHYSFLACHYHCNLADKFIEDKDFLSARRHLTQAQCYAKKQVRVFLLLARLEQGLQNTVKAKEICIELESICMQALPQVVNLYEEIFDTQELVERLMHLYRKHRHQYFLLFVCKIMQKKNSYSEVYKYFMHQLDLSMHHQEEDRFDMNITYQCSHCGSGFTQHRWKCLVCGQFESIRVQEV